MKLPVPGDLLATFLAASLVGVVLLALFLLEMVWWVGGVWVGDFSTVKMV